MRPTYTTAAALLLATLPAAAARAATIETFNDRVNYNAAVAAAGLGPGTVETFETPQDFNYGDNFYNGLNFRVGGDPRKTTRDNMIVKFNDGVTFVSALSGSETSPGTGTFYETLAYVLPTDSKAFGGDFILRDFGSGPGDGLFITVLGKTYDLRDFLNDNTETSNQTGNAYSGFFGVVADEAFTVVDPSTVDTGFAFDDYYLDNLTYSAAGAASPVPEPLAAVGAAVGLGGVILRRRRAIA